MPMAPPDPDELEDLAERAAAGDRDAAGRALTAVAPLVRRLTGRSVPARDRDEVVADALAQIFRGIHRFDRRACRFTTFASNHAHWHLARRRETYAKRRARMPTIPLSAVRSGRGDADHDPADDRAADPAGTAAARIDAAALWGRLGGLPDRQRAAVTDWANGVPRRETAAAWGTGVGAVSNARRDGLAALRRAAADVGSDRAAGAA